MGETELPDWFIQTAQRVARNNRFGPDLKSMPEGHWRRLIEIVELLARGSDERIPVDWREMLAKKVGREIPRFDGFGP